MTLCVIWRDGIGNVHFASDSRITVKSNGSIGYPDVGIKVMSIPYKIYEPTEPSGQKNLLLKSELGICFSGSASNTFFIKETLVEILKKMQIMSIDTCLSMDNISDFAFRIYKKISEEMCLTLKENGITTIAIGGYCPRLEKVRVFLLENTISGFECNEVIKNNLEYKFLGSGNKFAEDAYQQQSSLDHDLIRTLKKIIEDKDVKDVGGNIQYGKFNNKSFEVFGVAEYVENDDEPVKYWRGAININSEIFSTCFISNYPYIDIFGTFK